MKSKAVIISGILRISVFARIFFGPMNVMILLIQSGGLADPDGSHGERTSHGLIIEKGDLILAAL